jgi:hypothetical protein
VGWFIRESGPSSILAFQTPTDMLYSGRFFGVGSGTGGEKTSAYPPPRIHFRLLFENPLWNQ